MNFQPQTDEGIADHTTVAPLADDPDVIRTALYKSIGIVAAAAVFFFALWSIYRWIKKRCSSRSTVPDHCAADIEAGNTTPHTDVGFFMLYRFASATDVFLLTSGMICSSAVGLVWPAFYVLMGSVLDAFVYSADPIAAVSQYCIYLAIIGAGGFVAGFGALACWMLVSERQTNVLRTKYLESMLNQDQAWYDAQADPATLGARFTLDVVEYYKGTGERVSTLVTCVVGFAAGLAVGLWKGWQLALLVLAISPLHGGLVAKLEKCVSAIDERLVDLATEASAIVLESVNLIRTVKTFNGQTREYNRFAEKVEEAEDAGVRKSIRAGIVSGLTWFSIFVSYGVALWFGCWLIRTGKQNDLYGRPITGGDVVTTFWSVLIAAMTLGELGPCWAALSSSQGAAARLFCIIDRVPSIDSTGSTSTCTSTKSTNGNSSSNSNNTSNSNSNNTNQKVELPAAITFKGVHFAYPSRLTTPVLTGLNLTIEPGTKVALVGASGQGKSTVIALLERYYDAQAGSIAVGGTELVDLDLNWWRSNVAVVSQEPALLLGSVMDNIALGMPDVSFEQVHAAAEAANAHEFIAKLPYGYSTFVGEGGALLSGGQKQRIAIARAVLRDPKVLLLDEATSALDAHNEVQVQGALDKLMKGRTVVVVAHRLATIKNADKICVFEGGKIVEEGTHQHLLARGMRYAALAAGQFEMSYGVDSEPLPSAASSSAAATPLAAVQMIGAPSDSSDTSDTDSLDGSYASTQCTDETNLASNAFAGFGGYSRGRSDSMRERCNSIIDSSLKAATLAKSNRRQQRRRKNKVGSSKLQLYHGKAAPAYVRPPSFAAAEQSDEFVVIDCVAVEQEMSAKAAADAAAAAAAATAFAAATAAAAAAAAAKPTGPSLSEVLGLITNGGWYWFVAVAGSIFIGAHMPVWSVVFSKMVDVLYDTDHDAQARESLNLALIFGGLGVVFFFAALAQSWGLGVLGEQLSATLKKKTFSNILRQEAGWFDLWENNSYTLNHRLTTNTAMTQTATIKPVGFGIQAVATFVTGLAIAFAHGWKLALVGTAVIPFLVGTAMIQYKYILSFSGEEKAAFEFAGAVSSNALGNIRAVQAAAAQKNVLAAFTSKLEITGRIGRNRAIISGLCFGLFYFTVCCAYALCFWYSAVLIAAGEITFNDAMVVIFSIVVAAVDVGQACARLLPGLGSATAAQSELFRMMNRVPTIPEEDVATTAAAIAAEAPVVAAPHNKVGTQKAVQGADATIMAEGAAAPVACSFDSVHFTYPARPLAPVLNGLSLEVKKGETIAIVGASGGGKSTLFNLLLRLYQPSSGTVKLNGVDSAEMDVKTLRSKIGVVGQQPGLFEATISENIGYGGNNNNSNNNNTRAASKATKAAIVHAAKLAGAHDFIMALPQGYDTDVGSLALSGGQKQRIAIARALVREPSLLLLDEATSALDSESEAVVQASLDTLMQDPSRSVMVIAHRLSTVRSADRIAVVSNGHIAEVGTHEELLSRVGGLYSELCKASLV